MPEHISATAARIANVWALGRRTEPTALARRGIARQVQDHLEHGADPDHLLQVADWMAHHQPTMTDLDAAMRFSSAPQPRVRARSGHPCVCRGGRPHGGGAPVPPIVRQLIRRTPRRPHRAA